METTEIKTVVKLITPEHAKELLSRVVVKRKLKESRIQLYAHQMRIGEWALTGESIKLSKEGYLLDGNHRLNAIIRVNIPQLCVIMYGLNKDIFHKLDTGSNRSGGDVLSILNVMNSSTLSSIIVRYLARTNNPNYKSSLKNGGIRSDIKITNTDILNTYESNPEYWTIIVKEAQSIYSRYRICDKSLVGSMMAYLELNLGYSREETTGFFHRLVGIIDNEYPIIKRLFDELINNKISKKTTKPITLNAYYIKAWNAYITGNKQARYLRLYEDEEYPELLPNNK